MDLCNSVIVMKQCTRQISPSTKANGHLMETQQNLDTRWDWLCREKYFDICYTLRKEFSDGEMYSGAELTS